jgi:hypothetical protein
MAATSLRSSRFIFLKVLSKPEVIKHSSLNTNQNVPVYNELNLTSLFLHSLSFVNPHFLEWIFSHHSHYFFLFRPSDAHLYVTYANRAGKCTNLGRKGG